MSVILPTREWGAVCEDLCEQLESDDELLVVCDSESDPVRSTPTPSVADVLVAGSPVECSGKANAVAHAMERATNDRFVWTDDDFERDGNWVSRLTAHGRRYGPATVIPVFVGEGWWRLLEPWVVLFATFSFYIGFGPWGGNAWGGGVTFTRDDVDVDRLVADLRQGLSDDGILSAHLGAVHPVRSMRAIVDVPGDFAAVKHRIIRFNRLTHVHEGAFTPLVLLTLSVGLAMLFPVVSAVALTLGMAAVYGVVGLRRWTFLLAFPTLFVTPVLAALGIACSEFVWAGRRYRLEDAGNVEVLEE